MRLVKSSAIFLDRDGTLNQDCGYTHRIEDWVWLPGAIAGLAALARAGWLLVVASNQSGVGRGYYDFRQVKELENWVAADLKRRGVAIAAWQYCTHLPGAGCSCRKPQPGLLLQAADSLRIDLASSWMLGDKPSDIEAGLAAGCKAGLIASCDIASIGQVSKRWPEVPVWPTLEQAAKEIGQPT